mgnify:CR=1 FL=1
MFKQCCFALAICTTAISGCYAKDATEWRKLSLDNTVLLTLPQGKVVIELAPQFSPKHVNQFKSLVEKRFYDGEKFYRVIDGFVAQAGPEDGSEKDKSVSILPIEDEWSIDESWQFTPVQQNDLFAPTTGFKEGFAIGHDASAKKAWLTHCPGVIAMARNNEPNSATSHFYIVNGQAPRYLDRIMTIFGRVVYGMNHVQAITRTAGIEGDPKVNGDDYTPIVSMQLMKDVLPKDRILIEVESTESKAFADKLAKRKLREPAFFYKKPPPVLDICQTPVKSRLVTAG